MIEDRLRETFDRVAAGGPAEAGAFDRFQRHRRTHRSRRLAGATWKDGTYEDGGDLSRAFTRRPEGRQSRGNFPGDRRWFRTDLQAGRWASSCWTPPAAGSTCRATAGP